jgi:hypothetical protein
VHHSLRDSAIYERLQRGQIILNNIPDDIDSGVVIGVPQHISEIDHFLPLDMRCVPFDVIGKPSRRLTDYFEVTLGCHAPHFVRGEHVRLLAASIVSIFVMASKISRNRS